METVSKGGYAYLQIRTFSNGNNVIEKIAKYLILSLLGLSALTYVAVLVLDDELIKNTTGGAADTLLGIKHDTIDTVSEKSDTFVYWFRTKINDIMNFSPTNRTPRVVMRIPPPPENITRMPANEAKPGMPADKPAAVPPMPATMPETTPTEMASTAPATAKPEAAPTEPMNAAPAMSAIGNGTPAMEGAPAPVPVTAVSEQPLAGSMPDAQHGAATTEQPPAEPAAMGEQASLPASSEAAPTDAPPPPPAAEEQRPGEADYQQGLKYYNGDGVEQNFGKAAQFFMKAGEAGHVGAQYNLGIMNYTGQTGGQDFANAAKWFERAAESGHTQAQYNLGFLYYEGKGVAQDLKTAFDWINRAAERGYPKAIKARDAFKQAMPEMFPAEAEKPAN
ncbi:hypothetical protein L2D14_06680 [Thalassospiraceae bacterium LMO-JJ14]|nr:hypothetical protein L2D14_06680 [Thalassospiraceae bacterium LMO-JJ14]